MKGESVTQHAVPCRATLSPRHARLRLKTQNDDSPPTPRWLEEVGPSTPVTRIRPQGASAQTNERQYLPGTCSTCGPTDKKALWRRTSGSRRTLAFREVPHEVWGFCGPPTANSAPQLGICRLLIAPSLGQSRSASCGTLASRSAVPSHH